MKPPVYLTPGEVAQLLGVVPRSVTRRIDLGELPTLDIHPQIRRVEAAALLEDADAPLPPGPTLVTVPWLAPLLRLHVISVQKLVVRGCIPMWKQGGQANGRYTMHRRELWHWLMRSTRGDEVEPGQFPIREDALVELRARWAREADVRSHTTNPIPGKAIQVRMFPRGSQ